MEQHIHAKWSTMHVNNGYWSEEVASSSSEEEEEERRGRRIADDRAVVGISALRRGGGRRGGPEPRRQIEARCDVQTPGFCFCFCDEIELPNGYFPHIAFLTTAHQSSLMAKAPARLLLALFLALLTGASAGTLPDRPKAVRDASKSSRAPPPWPNP